MKNLLFILCFFLVNRCFSQISKILERELADNSSLIIEGKVIDQRTIQFNTNARLVTINTVKVYKVFKGKIHSYYIEILTEGGSLGNVFESAEDLLQLSKNDAGIFFLTSEKVMSKRFFVVYGGSQGFLKYDIHSNSAHSAFITYNHVKLYPHLEKVIGIGYIVIDSNFLFPAKARNKRVSKIIDCKPHFY